MTFQLYRALSYQNEINIGFEPHTQEDASIIDRYSADAFGVFAMTSYGKTLFVRNLLVQLKDRRIIIFDSRGEHKHLRTTNAANADGKGDSIPDLVYIERFGFKLSDMINAQDWKALGLNISGARICAGIARQKNSHRNEIELFLELIDDIKTKGKDASLYMTKMSILAKVKNVSSCFVDNSAVDITHSHPDKIRYTNNPFYISDWKYFIKAHKHVCINFNSEYQPFKAQFFAGKLLNEISPILRYEPAVILLEEAHNLFPYSDAPSANDELYSSNRIYYYLKSKHKDMVKLIFVTQHPRQLNSSAFDEIKWYFIGKLENIDGSSRISEMFKMSNMLNYNPLNDYREWLCYSSIYNKKFVFVPYDSATFYMRRK